MNRNKKGGYAVCAQQSVNSRFTMERARRLPVLITLALFYSSCAAEPVNRVQPALTPEAYIGWHGGTLAPAGTLEIDGRRMSCGQWPTVLDPGYDDFGAA